MTVAGLALGTLLPIAEIIRLMMAHRIKRIPIVDASGQPVGLIGRAGVLAALSQKHS